MTDTALSPFTASIGGVSVSLVADPDHPERDNVGYQGSYEAQESTNQLVHRDVPKVLSSFRKGAGYVRRSGPQDDNGYAWSESMMMWLGEGPIPAGQVHTYSLTGTFTNDNARGALPLTNGRIVEMIEMDGHLWLIFDKPAIVKIANADPASTPDYSPAINNGTYGTTNTSLGLNNNGRCAEIFRTAAGAAALYVGTNNSGTGRVYEYTAGAWAAGTVNLTYTADLMRSVYWTTKSDGTGAQRLLMKTAAGEIRHCIEGFDPKLSASYVTPIKVGTPGNDVYALEAAPQHAFAVTTGGIVDFDELRVRELTPYWRLTRALTSQLASINYRLPSLLWNDHIYASRGFGSIDRYPISTDAYQQRIVGECGIGFLQDGTPIQGWFSAFCDSGDGGILAALYNPDNKTTYIGRGFDRSVIGIDGPGPILWHWAEVVIPPTGGTQGLQVTAMRVCAPALSVGTALAAPKVYLWLALIPSTGGQAQLKYVELPLGTGPLSIRASGGTSMLHAPAARLYMTGQQYEDANSLKAARRLDLSHQGVSSTATIAAYVRADGDPATLTDDSTWTLEGTANATSPDTATTTNIVPATVTTGKMIYTHQRFTTPSPYTAPPRLQELRLRCNVRYEVFEVLYLNVVLLREYETRNGTPDVRAQDSVLASIVAFQLTGPVTFVNDRGTYQALVEQGIRYTRGFVEGVGWRTIARVEISIVKQVS